jgi:O-acetyl-ADP-ribose deacetylase (regulator of RNase III)
MMKTNPAPSYDGRPLSSPGCQDAVARRLSVMSLEWILIDRKPALIRAWQQAFHDTPVRVQQGDCVHAAQGSAWVSPANSFGWMDGGLNWTIRQAYDAAYYDITRVVQTAIRQQAAGELLVGQALVIPTPDTPYTHLIVAPTLRTPRPAFWTLNAYLAFRAILLTVGQWNLDHADQTIPRLYCPGLATGMGRMPAPRCARQMRTAWDQVTHPSTAWPALRPLMVREQWLRYR